METQNSVEKKENLKIILTLRQIVRDLTSWEPNKIMAQQRILDAIDWLMRKE